MKKKVFINYSFESKVEYCLKIYLLNFGENATLTNGRSRRMTYGFEDRDYQVTIWQTKIYINIEVVR